MTRIDYQRGPCGGGTSIATKPPKQTVEQPSSNRSIYWGQRRDKTF